MKWLKKYDLAGLLLFYLLSGIYAWSLMERIQLEPKLSSDFFNLIFLNLTSFDRYYLSRIDPILYLLYFIFLIVYVYDHNKRVFDDKTFYQMIINRYGKVNKAFWSLLAHLGKVSIKLFTLNVLICMVLFAAFPWPVMAFCSVICFLIKISVYTVVLSIPLQKTCLDQEKKAYDMLAYMLMLAFVIIDVLFGTHFMTYANDILTEMLFIVIGIVLILLQCGAYLIKNKKGKIYD